MHIRAISTNFYNIGINVSQIDIVKVCEDQLNLDSSGSNTMLEVVDFVMEHVFEHTNIFQGPIVVDK